MSNKTGGIKIVFFMAQVLIVTMIGISLVMLQARVHAAPATGVTKTAVIPVEGMSCMSCVARVKRTLAKIDGVEEVTVSLEKREARIRYIEGKVTPARLAEEINSLGYRAGTPRAEESK